ncbi:MAG: hypothetical protein HRT92_07425 [Piscirickettsiaceae bacterium]|nr:hypothetical protein [Piscirickettsiaceae bacterium]
MTIYLIFSQEGFVEAQESLIADKASLWVNQDFLSDEQVAVLTQHNIELNLFIEFVDGSDVKSIDAALKPIEKQTPKAEILVEYL